MRNTNKKDIPWWMDKSNNKYIYWGILGLFGFMIIISLIFSNDPDYIKNLDERYLGTEFTDYNYEYFNRTYGPGVALYYSSQMWVYYYPKGDFTLKVSKKNNRIIDFEEGRKSK